MSLFPKEITEKVSWELDKFEGQPLALRNWVREKTQCLQWDGSTAKGKAHLLEGGGEDGEASDELDSLRDQGLSEDMPDGELAAFVRKRLFNKDKRFPQGAGRPRQAPARDRAPARSKEDMTCPNCLEKGHSSQECTKPKIDVKDRRCFLCKEKGHAASKCPKAKQLKSLTSRPEANNTPPATVFAWSLESSDDFVPAHRPVRRMTAPQKKEFTINEEIESAFTKLARIEATEQCDDDLDEEPIASRTPDPALRWPRQRAAEECAELCLELGRWVCPLVPENVHPRDCRHKKAKSKKEPGCCAGHGGGLTRCLRTMRSPDPSDKEGGVCGAIGVRTDDGCVAETPESLDISDTEIHANRQQLRHNEIAISSLCRELAAQGEAINSFYGIVEEECEIHALPEAEPEYIEVEMALDSGASVHAADRVDFPGHEVRESAGSKAGQKFGCAGGKMLPNEGESDILMVAPGGIGCEISTTIQIAKITRPLLSVSQMTRNGNVQVLFMQDEARVKDNQGRLLAVFRKKGGLYVANMQVKNPKYRLPFGGQAR